MLSRSCLSTNSLQTLSAFQSRNKLDLSVDDLAHILLDGLNDGHSPEKLAQTILNKMPAAEQTPDKLKSLTSFVTGFLTTSESTDLDCGPSAMSELVLTHNKVSLTGSANILEHTTKDVSVRVLDVSISGSLNGLPIGVTADSMKDFNTEALLQMIETDPIAFALTTPSLTVEGNVVSNKFKASDNTDFDLDLFHAEFDGGLSASVFHLQANHREEFADNTAIACSGALDLMAIGGAELSVAPNAFTVGIPLPFAGLSLNCEYETGEIYKETQYL